jgi:hypothetical protein
VRAGVVLAGDPVEDEHAEENCRRWVRTGRVGRHGALLSALQHMRQIHAGSPTRTIRMVRLLWTDQRVRWGSGGMVRSHDAGRERSQTADDGAKGHGAKRPVRIGPVGIELWPTG